MRRELMIVDILFTIGMISFFAATIRQIRKLLKTHNTDGISQTHYHIKTFAIICMTAGYAISGLPLSFIVSSIEVFIHIYLMYLIRIYRNEENKIEKDDDDNMPDIDSPYVNFV